MISVIVPVYKVEKFIHRCINSILAQTFTDFELILIDDGSPDKCGLICDYYAEQNQRIHVIHKKNGGLSDARNTGIEWALQNSDSEWITFIDSDDWVHPQFLEYLYKAATDNNQNIAICRYLRVCKLKNSVDTQKYLCSICETEKTYVHEKTNMIISCAKLFKKIDFEQIRFPIGRIHEDEFTIYKILFKYKKVAFVDTSLYYYYINVDSITKSDWNLKRLDLIDAYKQQIKFFKNNDYLNAYAYTARALLLAFADVIVNLRCFYHSKTLLRWKCIKSYYYYRLSGLDSFISSEDKKRISKSVHPQFYNKKKWIKKRASNFIEIIKGRITH